MVHISFSLDPLSSVTSHLSLVVAHLEDEPPALVMGRSAIHFMDCLYRQQESRNL
jgi:hypothetical protein